MTTALVTGGTGFIGRFLVQRLLDRGDDVHVLVRPASLDRLDALRKAWDGGDRVVPVLGDLHEPMLGLDREAVDGLRGAVDHLFHLAALYDLTASAHRLEAANVQGTWHAVQLAGSLQVGCVHHVSSIAAAGRYRGTFTEDMFEEATGLDDPYHRTKHAAERVVRRECRVPWRIYRPGIVVGHSETGEMDKVDGPYYLFGLLQRAAAALPASLRLVGVDPGTELQLVPVDVVAAALDHIAHLEGLDGRTFHLVDPDPPTTVEAFNAFARVAGAPRIVAPVGGPVGAGVARLVGGPLGRLPVRAAGAAASALFDVPPRLVRQVDAPTRFDCRQAQAALAGSGIEVPPLADYAPALWAWWEAELDADLRHDAALTRAVRGKRVAITGASAGIGRAAALKLGAAGARVALVARSEERLVNVRGLIEQAGGEAHVYACDLADPEACEVLADRLVADLGGVDVLVNNAGHSIRRSLEAEAERFGDYERLMRLNYFGALRLTLALLPGMRERGDGHIVNVSSMGVQTGGPRFSAYVASKSAFDAFARSAAAELLTDGVAVTTIYMPLVRTAMSKPTKAYDLVPELTSAQAAGWICRAVVERPRRMALPGATLMEALYLAAPTVADALESEAFETTEPGASADPVRVTAAVARQVVRRLPRRLSGLRRVLPVRPR